MARLTGRRGSTSLGPIRFNRAGFRLTSITLGLPFYRLTLWKATRR
jgi:hypothetical protein